MIKVTCAIIENQGKILLAQRSERMDLPLKWEFPGGKIEEGESPETCVKREILEELNIEIIPVKQLQNSVFHYPQKSITLIPFICNYIGGEILLKEHISFKWIQKESLLNFELAEADIPIAKYYLNLD